MEDDSTCCIMLLTEGMLVPQTLASLLSGADMLLELSRESEFGSAS